MENNLSSFEPHHLSPWNHKHPAQFELNLTRAELNGWKSHSLTERNVREFKSSRSLSDDWGLCLPKEVSRMVKMPIAKLVSGRHHLQRAREMSQDSALRNEMRHFPAELWLFPAIRTGKLCCPAGNYPRLIRRHSLSGTTSYVICNLTVRLRREYCTCPWH